MHLYDLWFIAIAVLWTGYFVLEGFDFGVGILLPLLARDDTQRRVLINTIGPVWDGNEVWLITAGGAMFAAFPGWYAAMFSAFYLPLLLVLVFLIARGVAFEFRGKHDDPRWRTGWDTALFLGSLVPAIGWGVVFGNVVRGIPLDAAHNYTGNLATLLNGYALLGGLATLALFTLHGAVFLALKTTGDLRRRARTTAGWAGLGTVLSGGGFLAWTEVAHRAPGYASSTGAASVGFAALTAAALLTAVAATRRGRDGAAFAGTAVAIAAVTGSLFTAVFPRVLPSTTDTGTLTVANASSLANTLLVMTVVAIVFLPFVLAYQGWTYWVFRKRIGAPPSTPAPTVPRTVDDPRRSTPTAEKTPPEDER